MKIKIQYHSAGARFFNRNGKIMQI